MFRLYDAVSSHALVDIRLRALFSYPVNEVKLSRLCLKSRKKTISA